MSRASRRNKGAGRPPQKPPAKPRPVLHVRLSIATTDLGDAADLIKPAVLYADKVTIYSPAATMLKHAHAFGNITDPSEQVSVMLTLMESVPGLGLTEHIDPATRELMRQFLGVDRDAARALISAAGYADQIPQIDEVYSKFDEMSDMWTTQMVDAVEQATANLEGEELMVAVNNGAVDVDDLIPDTPVETTAATVRAALGDSDDDHGDRLVKGFAARVVETLADPRAFPLLDAQASGLMRALEQEQGGPLEMPGSRGEEVAAAAHFMGFLPYFSNLSMAETIDLRRDIADPLIRFRAAMVELSSTFSSRQIDASFDVEVEDAWRAHVEPALLEIRDAFAARGLLREMLSVAGGDPRRLMAEAGGVFALHAAQLLSLSRLMAAAAAISLPVADVAARASASRVQAQHDARAQSMYFLHKVGEAARAAR
jgi:hypothetical protein